MSKILVFTSVYPPPFVGGAERSIDTIYTSIHGNEFEIHICALDVSGTSKSNVLLEPKLSVFRTPFKFIPHPITENFRITKLSKMIFHLSNLSLGLHWPTVLKQIRTFKPDVIVTHNLTGWGYSPWIFGNIFKIPIVHDNRDYYLACIKTTRWSESAGQCAKTCISCQPRKIATKFFWQKGTQISNSIFVDKYVRNLFARNKYTQYEIIYPPVELTKITENEHEPIYDIGFLGRIEKSKGVVELLASISGEGLSIAIAGEGSLKDSLEKRYPDAHFLGQISVNDFFNKIRVLVVPSLWAEPFGRVVLEAVNFGIPVVASENGGMLENKFRPGALIFGIDPKNLNEILAASRQALNAGRNTTSSTELWRDKHGPLQIEKFSRIIGKIAREEKK